MTKMKQNPNRMFGFECEVKAGAAGVLDYLNNAGVWEEGLHSYHCSCDDCDPMTGKLIHAQEDCTCDGEFIARATPYASDDAELLFTTMAAAVVSGRAVVGDGAGFHVHVDRRDLTENANLRVAQLFLRYQDEFDQLATGNLGHVRSYNAKFGGYRSDLDYVWSLAPGRAKRDSIQRALQLFFKGMWLAKQRNTWEFRVWNSTRAEWRMRLAVGVSVAVVNAAAARVNVTRDDPRSFEEVIGPFMDEDTWAGVLRQKFVHGGIAA